MSASSASLTTSSSWPGSNQRSIPSYGFETIAAPALASSNGRHEDEAGNGGVRAARDVEVDPRGGDRLVEGVEGDVADEPGAAGVALEVAPAEGELELRRGAARLPHHRGHPVAAELVPVAVEEDVVQLLDRLRREELGVGAPEDRLRPPGAELEQARQPALRVRDDEVVLGRIGAVVVVEARVHAAELGQAHRHVAVVEDHRHAEALAQVGRDAAEVRHRDGEDDHRVDVLLGFEHLRQVPLPARRHPAPDRLAGRLVEDGLVRRLLGAAQVPVALQPREPAAHGGEALTLDPGRVRRRPPPRRLDRPAAVRGHDQVGRRPRTCPSRAATTRACSRSGSRGRPPTRRRGSSALSRWTA